MYINHTIKKSEHKNIAQICANISKIVTFINNEQGLFYPPTIALYMRLDAFTIKSFP